MIQEGGVGSPGDVWQCLERFVVVATEGDCYALVGRGQDPSEHCIELLPPLNKKLSAQC